MPENIGMQTKNITEKYLGYKSSLGLKQRYYDIFEYRNGLTDGKVYTQRETGEKFGIGPTRVRQIEARVVFEVQKKIDTNL